MTNGTNELTVAELHNVADLIMIAEAAADALNEAVAALEKKTGIKAANIKRKAKATFDDAAKRKLEKDMADFEQLSLLDSEYRPRGIEDEY